ncbi:MAG: helix-turn-helix transcriptional regulator [Gammaproteobacteria bacterium]
MQWVRARELAERLSISRTTLWRLAKDPSAGFPAPRRLAPNVVAWDLAEIKKWCAEKKRICAARNIDEQPTGDDA